MTLQPYVKNTQVFHCPSERTPWFSNDDEPILNGNPTSGSYAHQSWGQWSLASIAAPAEYITFWDTGNGAIFGNNAWIGEETRTGSFRWGSNFSPFAARHNGQLNVAWGDGHVKTAKCADIFPCTNHVWMLDNITRTGTSGCWVVSDGNYTADDGTVHPSGQCP